MPRIAVIGTKTETPPLIAAAERLPQLDCVRIADDSPLDDFDAVAFCSSYNGGIQPIADAARCGKHLLVDLTTLKSAEEANTLIAACRAANVRLMIGQPLRFLPSIQAIQQSLDAGQLGEPGVLRVHRWANEESADINPLLVREIDLANWLFGQIPETVYAIARGTDKSTGLVQVHLGFTHGGSALIDVTTSLPACDDYYSLSIIGSDGSAYADDHHNTQLLLGGGPATTQRTSQSTLHWTAQWREFAAAIAESREPSIGGEAAAAALTVIDAIDRSIELGNALRRQGDRYEPV